MLLSGAANGLGSWLLSMFSTSLLRWFVSFLIGVASYVLTGWGLYTVAKRRGVRYPWLAWIPLGQLWVLGKIADHYQRERNRKACSWTYLLMAFTVLAEICGAFMEKSYRNAGLALLQEALNGGDILAVLEQSIDGVLLLTIIHLVVALVAAVIEYIVLYAYYRSCLPQKATLFLVLSIVFSITRPFFVFYCRKWDLGMPELQEKQLPAS